MPWQACKTALAAGFEKHLGWGNRRVPPARSRNALPLCTCRGLPHACSRRKSLQLHPLGLFVPPQSRVLSASSDKSGVGWGPDLRA